MASLESTRLLYKPFNLICGSVTNDNNDGGEFYYSTSADIAPPMKIDQGIILNFLNMLIFLVFFLTFLLYTSFITCVIFFNINRSTVRKIIFCFFLAQRTMGCGAHGLRGF